MTSMTRAESTRNAPDHEPQLPAWPGHLPAPTVTLDFPLGTAETYVEIEGDKVHFWRWKGQDHVSNTHDDGLHFSPNDRPWLSLTTQEKADALAWGTAVQERAEYALTTLGAPVGAGTSAADLVLAYATGERNSLEDATPSAVVPAAGVISFDVDAAAALPVLPATVPEPAVTLAYPRGAVATSVTIDGETVKFWRWNSGARISNSADYPPGGDLWESLGSKGRKAALAWGAAVHARAESAVASAGVAVAGSVAGSILDYATGKKQALTSSEDSSAARMGAAMELWPDTEDGPQSRIQDMLTDVRHYCKAHGLDLEAALAGSADAFESESGSPYFTHRS